MDERNDAPPGAVEAAWSIAHQARHQKQLAALLDQLRASDPDGEHYSAVGELVVPVPEPLRVTFEASSTERQAVAGVWADGVLSQVITWQPVASGDPWRLEEIESAEDADSVGVVEHGWPSGEEDDA